MSDALRVLLVLGTSGGGVGRHVRDLARSLVEDGHEIVVAGPQSVQDDLDLTGVGARFVPVPIAERPSPTSDPRSIRTLRRLLDDCDVVHAHGLRAGGLVALARGWASRPPLVVTLHNALVGSGVVAAAYAVLERLVARRADLVLAVSADLEERQRSLGARQVGHAVVAAAPAAPPTRTPAEVRTELGLGRETPLVVAVARLADQKGLPVLLDAAAILRERAPQPVVAVAGDGPLRAVLTERISRERLPVRLLGWRADVPELLAAADVVVSSAVWEGQPIWLQEALAAGRAIVATDVGGTAQVTGPAARLVPPGDGAALAEAVGDLLGDAEARGRLERAALERAQNLPDAAATRAAAVRAYRGLVSPGAEDC